jgi:DNA-binding XRE family transcriptional regulator
MVPLNEYERLSRAVEAQELLARLQDPQVKWVDARDAFAQIAGSWIAQARKRAGLTQSQLAERVGVPQSQISRIERNPDRTTVRTMKRVAAALGVEVAELLSFGNNARRGK